MFNRKLNEATLKLFRCLTYESKTNEFDIFGSFIITDKILKQYSQSIVSVYKNVFNIDKLNNTFFTLKQTLETDDYERVLHQIMHYISTYGAEMLNIDIKTYVPNKYYGEVNINELDNPIYIPVIVYDELKKIVLEFIDTDVGLSNMTLDNLMIIIEELVKEGYISKKDFVNRDFKNRDLIAKIYNYFGWLPNDVEDIIRLILSQHNKIKIKNKSTFRLLSLDTSDLFKQWLEETDDAVVQMAKTWRRNRFYFLALKSTLDNNGKSMINKARKLSNKLYKPIKIENILDIQINEFKERVKEERWYTLVKWYNYLIGLTLPIRIIYIRNGKLKYVENKNNVDFSKLTKYLVYLNSEIEFRFKTYFDKKFNNKIIFINYGQEIVLPTSDKKIIGGVPELSSFVFDKEWKYVGIHWFNLSNSRVDLDLSSSYTDGNHISWNTNWKIDEDVVFSGDVTDAPKPNGATEIIAFKDRDSKLFMVNDYTGNFSNQSYTLFIGSFDELKDKTELNSLLYAIPIKFPDIKQATLGISIGDKFIFLSRKLVDARVASNSNIDIEKLVNSIDEHQRNILKLQDFISYTTDVSIFDEEVEVVDLSLDKLTTDFWNDLFNNMY